MKVTTQQVDGVDALRALADGKYVEMVWMNGTEPVFSNLNEKIKDAMRIGETFLIVDIEENCDSAADEPKNCENATPTLEGIIEQLEEDVKTDVVTDQEIEKKGPITKKIDGNPANNKRRRRLDTEKVIALRKDGWSVNKIADEMNAGWNTVNSIIVKAEKEGKL